MKYPLDSKHHNQMMRFCSQRGLDIGRGMRTEDLIAKIEKAYPGITEFELDEGEAEAEDEVPVIINTITGEISAHYKNDPIVIVNIQSNEANGGNHPVPLCVNGDHILVKRNTNVPIPYRFFRSSLMDAVETVYRQEPNAMTGKPDTIVEQRLAYQVSVLKVPTEEEIAAWRERTKDIGREKKEDLSLKNAKEAIDGIAAAILTQLREGASAPS